MRTSPSTSEPCVETTSQVQKWGVLIAIGVGTFMSALDGSVVNATLPLIAQSLRSHVAAVEWVVTVYLLILSGLLLSLGRLGDLRGHKRVYLGGFVIFLLSSIFCSLAPNVNVLILFRAIQAVGAAMLSSNSPAILTKSFPAQQRGQALGLQATMTYLGLTVGPSLGGYLAEMFTWRAIFYINVPIALVAIYLSHRYIPGDQRMDHIEPFDHLGSLVFMMGLILLLLGLNQGYALGWLSPWILASIGLALLLLSVFFFIEMKVPYPMLDLSLLRSRIFSFSVIAAVLNYICVYTITFLMPFYLLQGRQFTPTQSGALLTAMPITMAVIAPISGTISDRIGTRWPTVVGMLTLGCGLFLLSRLDQASTLPQIVVSLAVAGLGIGIFISPNTSALMGAAPRHRQGIAAGILATARNLGMVLGVGFAGAILTSLAGHELEALRASLFPALRSALMVAMAFAFLGFLLSLSKAEQPLWKEEIAWRSTGDPT